MSSFSLQGGRPGLAGYYLLEGLNALGTNVFFLGVYFHARVSHGFSDTANLLLAATQGAAYVAATRAGGRLADRVGAERSIATGLAGMGTALLAAWLLDADWALFAAMAVYSASTALTWPALEAAIARAPGQVPLARRTGLYNTIWSSVGAAGFFLSGALFAIDSDTVFWAPLLAHVLQLAGLALAGTALTGQDRRAATSTAALSRSSWTRITETAEGWRGGGGPRRAERSEHDGGPQRSILARGQDPAALTGTEPPTADAKARYLRSAWVANGLNYFFFGAFTAIAPTLGEALGLGPRLAIWLVSSYLFSRSAVFLLLWLWTGWEHRSSWLSASLVLPPAAFLALILAGTPSAAIAALTVLGAMSGLAYASSLRASLDREGREGREGEGGGLHEWVIGVGILLGPLAGAAGTRLTASTTAAGILVAGLGAGTALAGLAPLLRRTSER